MNTELLGAACESANVPGAVVAIATAGDMDVSAWGVASSATSEPFTAAHQFPPMSIVKSMTAALIAGLNRSGDLSLESAVADVLPGVAGDEWAQRVTVDHLLACTGGMSAFHFPDTGETDDAVAKFAETLGDPTLLFAPGTRFSYSNTSFSVLAAIAEAVTGRVYDDLVADSIFRPASMTDSGSWYRREPALPVDQHLVAPDGTVMPIGWWRLRSNGGAGAGTIFTTAADLAQYGRWHVTAWPELRQPQTEFPGPHAEAWGRGWALYGWGAGVFGWDGFAPAGRAFLRVFPEHDAAVALFANGAGGRLVYRDVISAVAREYFGVTPAPETWATDTTEPDRGSAGSIAGTYTNGLATVTITPTGDGYALQDSMGRGFPLRPVGPDRFVTPDEFEYPTVEFIEPDLLSYFCSVWRRTG
ncbi:MAG: serine hydrolase domain-containing protein [Acidimicrobiales bacterium]|nr:serine hydrolase domain-containing protein [Acidimicrobiales bacterium]